MVRFSKILILIWSFCIISNLSAAPPSSLGMGVSSSLINVNGQGVSFVETISLTTEYSIFGQDDDWNFALRSKVDMMKPLISAFSKQMSLPDCSLEALIRYTFPFGLTFGLGGGATLSTEDSTATWNLVVEPSYMFRMVDSFSSLGVLRIALPFKIGMNRNEIVFDAGLSLIFYLK